MEAIAGFLFSAILAIAIGIISIILGMFFGNIIMFESIGLGIITGLLCKNFLSVHPAFCLLIGLAVFGVLLFIQKTRAGFWIIGGALSLTWGFIFSVFGYVYGGSVWGYVVWGLGTVFMIFLHIIAKSRQ